MASPSRSGGRNGGGSSAEQAAAQGAKACRSLLRATQQLVRVTDKLGSRSDSSITRKKAKTQLREGRAADEELSIVLSVLRSGNNRRAWRQQIKDFEGVQKDFARVRTKYLERKRSVPVPSDDRGSADDGGDEGGDEDSRGRGQHQQQEQLQRNHTVEVELAIAREEQAETRRIMRDAVDLRQLTQDTSDLVHEDSERVDEIVENTQDSKENMYAGNDNISEAINIQQQYRKKLCFMACIVILILALICIPVLVKVL